MNLDRLLTVYVDLCMMVILCKRAGELLNEMKATTDGDKMDEVLEEVHDVFERIDTLGPALMFVGRINQTGKLRRMRADRLLTLSESTGEERFNMQIARDLDNVKWLGDSAEACRGIILDAMKEAA